LEQINHRLISMFAVALAVALSLEHKGTQRALEYREHKSKFVVFSMIQTSPIFTDLKYSSCPIMLALWLYRISVRVHHCLVRQSQQLSSSMKKLPARPSTLKIEMDLNNLLHETASWLILFVIQISNAGPFTQLSCKTASCSSLTKDNDTNISTLWALNGGGSRLPNLFVVKSKEIISSILISSTHSHPLFS